MRPRALIRPFTPTVATIVLATLASAVLSTTAHAQGNRVYFPRDAEVQRLLDGLALYEREERWPEALDAVNALLGRLEGPAATADLLGDTDGEVRHSLADEMLARLARWPARGILAFRAAHEAKARSFLERARSATLPRAPWEVVRFFPTEAAGEALALAAAYHLERGEAMLAIRALDWAGAHPDRPIPERARAFRLAIAWSILGRSDRATQALARAGEAPLRVGGELVSPRVAAATLDFARAPIALRANWHTPGGSPARDAAARVAPDLGAPRLDVDASCLAPSLPRRLARAARGLPPLVPGPPATSADRLIAAGAATVAAWDTQTGELAWQFPDVSDPAYDDPGQPSSASVHLDGGELYATAAGGVFRIDPRAGRVAWAYRTDPTEAGFGDHVTALSGPLVLDDRVLVVATRVEGDVRTHLVVLDRATGALISKALLCTSSSPTPLGYGYPAAAPSLASGELVVGTEHGAIVALDPASLTPRWGLPYPRHPDAVLARLVFERRLRAPRPVAIVGSVYCLAPSDSPYALGIDAVTRGELWRHPMAPDESLFAACRDAVIVGGRSLRGLDPQSGLVRWERALAAHTTDAMLVGPTDLFVSAGAELLRLDRATGEIRARRLVPHPGRLAPCAGGVALLGETSWYLLPPAPARDDTLEARIRALQGVDPDDADAPADLLAREVGALVRGAPGEAEARREWGRYARLRLRGVLAPRERARWLGEAARACADTVLGPELIRAWAIATSSLPGRDAELEVEGARATEALAALAGPIPDALAEVDAPWTSGAPRPPEVAATPAVTFRGPELARLLRAAPRASPPAPEYEALLDPRRVDLAWFERPEVQRAQERDPGRMRTILAKLSSVPTIDAEIRAAIAERLADLHGVPPLAPLGSAAPRLAWKSALPTSLTGPGVRALPVLGACAPAVAFPLGLSGDRVVQLRDAATGALVWHASGILARPLGVATVGERGLVLFGGMLVAIDLATGEPCWGHAPGLVAALTAGDLTGAAWQARLGGTALVAIACRPGAVYAAGSKTLALLNPETGTLTWRQGLSASAQEGCLVATASAAYVGLAPRTIAVFGRDGNPRAGLVLPTDVGVLEALERRGNWLLARCTSPGHTRWLAIAVERDAPRVAWTVERGAGARALPSGGRELIVDDGGELVVHDGATGEPRWTTDRRGLSPAARADGESLVVAWRAGDRLACAGLDLADGRQRWMATAPHGPMPADVVPIGRDRALIRPAEGSEACLLADAGTGTITEQRLPHHHSRVERIVPAGTTLVVDTDAGLAGLALEPDEVLRAELFRAWPDRRAPLVAPTVARALAALSTGPGAGARFLAGAARSAEGGWAGDLRTIDLVQGGQEVAGDARADRRVIRAPRFARAPVIDGQLNERWDLASSVELDGHDAVRLLLDPDPIRGWAPWQGVSDHSLQMFLGWDDTYLYLAMRVRDDRNTMFDEETPQRWSGDVAFFSFDPADDGGYSYNQHEDFAFWFYNPKPRKRQPPPANAGDRKAERRTVDGVLTAIDWTDEAHRSYELAIPWALLKRFGHPAPGKRLGFDVLILDDDRGTGCTRGLSLSPGNLLDFARTDLSFVKRFHPQRFPQIELAR